jgi:hypothetical protein
MEVKTMRSKNRNGSPKPLFTGIRADCVEFAVGEWLVGNPRDSWSIIERRLTGSTSYSVIKSEDISLFMEWGWDFITSIGAEEAEAWMAEYIEELES